MVRRVIPWIVFIGVLVLPVARAFSDTWTNAAGDTFEANPLECDGRKVVFQRPTGEQIRMPLFSLSADEQKRVKVYFNGPEVPAAVRMAYDYASGQIDRARLLFQDGRMGDKDFASRREEIIRSFKKTCEQHSYDESGDEVQQLVARLLAR